MKGTDFLKKIEGIDPGILDESEKYVPAAAGKSGRKKTGLIVLIAAVTALLITAAAVIIADRAGRGHDVHADNTSDETAEDVPVRELTAPWKDGRLRATAVTYKKDSEKLESANIFSFLSLETETGNGADTGGGEETGAGAEESADPVKVEEAEVSMMDNIKITSASGADLIRITSPEKGHEDCDGVFYDVHSDEAVCMSCRIRDMMKGNEYYTDAAIRAFIEECVIGPDTLVSAEVDVLYESVYNGIYRKGGYRLFSEGKRPTSGTPGIDEYWSDGVASRISKYKYPVIKIIEYGADPQKCVFTIASGAGRGVYGTFYADLEKKEFTKLDGESLNVPRCLNGYFSANVEDMTAIDMPAAIGVAVDSLYSTLVATVPYYVTFLNTDPQTGLFYPVYEGYNVFVFDLRSGSHTSVFGDSRWKTEGASYPVSAAKIQNGVVYFPVSGSVYGYFFNGRITYSEGEPLAIIGSTEDPSERYAVLKNEDGITFAAIGMVGTAPAGTLESPDVRYVRDGNEIINLTDMTRQTLYPETPDAFACSGDCRFVYAYFITSGKIVCTDMNTLETAEIAVGEEFTRQVSAGNVNIVMFASCDGSEIMLAYYRSSVLGFDSEKFLRDMHFGNISYGAAEESVKFSMSTALSCYSLEDGTRVSFRKTDDYYLAFEILAADRIIALRAKNKDGSMKALYAAVAEELGAIAEVSGNVAWISDETIKELLNGANAFYVRELFNEYTFGRMVSIYDAYIQLQDESGRLRTDEEVRRLISEHVADTLLLYFYGYSHVYEEELNITAGTDPKYHNVLLKYYSELNAGLDKTEMNALRDKLALKVYEFIPERGTAAEIGPVENQYCYYTDEMSSLVAQHIPELYEYMTGDSYYEAVADGKFDAGKYNRGYIFAQLALGNGCTVISPKISVDKEALDSLLAGIVFNAENVDMRTECTVSWEISLVPSSYYQTAFHEYISLGVSVDGRHWVKSLGRFAEISAENYSAIIRMFRASPAFFRGDGAEELLMAISEEEYGIN